MSFSCQWKKKKSKSEQIAVGLSSFLRTRLDRSDSSTVWTPPKKKKNKTKKRTLQPSVWPINISAALNDCLQYSLFCLFFVYLGFFNSFFFSLKACQLGSDLSWPLKRYLHSASRARRLHGSAVRGSEPIRGAVCFEVTTKSAWTQLPVSDAHSDEQSAADVAAPRVPATIQ